MSISPRECPEKASLGVRDGRSSRASGEKRETEPTDGRKETCFVLFPRDIDGIARRTTGRDTRGSREDSSAVNARTRAACCSGTRVEARLVDAREPSCGVSRRGSVRFCLSFPPSARAARGPVSARLTEPCDASARLASGRDDGPARRPRRWRKG